MNDAAAIKADHHHYVEYGQGEPLILLPSFGLTNIAFRTLGEKLGRYYRVIIPDLYHGKSTYAETAKTISDYVRALHSLIASLGISNFYLVGISYSGFIAADYSRAYPREMRKLFLISTSLVPIQKKWKSVVYPFAFLKLLLHNRSSQDGKKINKMLLSDALTNALKHPAQLLRDYAISLTAGDGLGSDELDVPTKIICAEQDEFFPPEIIKKMKAIKNLSVEVVPGGHTWFFNSEELMVEKAREFLR